MQTEAQPRGAQIEQDPQLVAMRGRYYRMPANYLDENLVEWTKLGISHRPGQYGFLTTLQQQPAEGKWPESEDASTLFGDLVRLLKLPHGDRMSGGGEGSDETFKFLAAPAEKDSNSAFYRSYVMKTLGYVPHFWHWGRGIGNVWKGFTEPDAFEAASTRSASDREESCVDDEEEDGDGDDDDQDEDDEDEAEFEEDEDFDFPGCSLRDAKRLFYHLRQHCQDWRSVCCNSNSDGYTPVFFVGQSKALPHRWSGYAGGKCWT
jgi:hypothetical protein